MALISYWSSQGNLPIDSPQVAGLLHNFQHRIAHLLAFGTLGLLARWAFDGSPRPWLLAVALVSAFGALDEFHQSFTPGRRAAVDDWAFDTASAALFVSVVEFRPQFRLRALAPAVVALFVLVSIGVTIRPGLPSGQGASLRNA